MAAFTLINSLENNLERKFSYLVPNYHEKLEARIVVNFSVGLDQ